MSVDRATCLILGRGWTRSHHSCRLAHLPGWLCQDIASPASIKLLSQLDFLVRMGCILDSGLVRYTLLNAVLARSIELLAHHHLLLVDHQLLLLLLLLLLAMHICVLIPIVDAL